MSDSNVTFQEVKNKIRKFVRERDWEQFHSPKNLSMSLAIEVAELMEMFQWLTTEESNKLHLDKEKRRLIEHEIADIAVFLFNLCNVLDVDLSKAVLNKMQQNSKKYPAKIVKGSAGRMGTWAEIPWIEVYDIDITRGAQKGYYIAYLFQANMEGVYLSLNQGYTQYTERYGVTKQSIEAISETAKYCRAILKSTLEDFPLENIELHGRGSLSKGYEAGHICGKYYARDSMPEADQLVFDLNFLIGVYRELKGELSGEPIVNELDKVKKLAEEEIKDDSKYQRDVQKAKPKRVAKGSQKKPVIKIQNGIKKWGTDPAIGKQALIDANYTCENDPTHLTFLSKTTGENYVEAHHLIPMEYQDEYPNLDINGNIVSLCPTCHRRFHHARDEERREIIEKFYNKRKDELKEYGIDITLDKLVSCYSE